MVSSSKWLSRERDAWPPATTFHLPPEVLGAETSPSRIGTGTGPSWAVLHGHPQAAGGLQLPSLCCPSQPFRTFLNGLGSQQAESSKEHFFPFFAL